MNQTDTNIQELVIAQTRQDFKNSILVVSALLNLVILITWLVIQADSNYALVLTSNL